MSFYQINHQSVIVPTHIVPNFIQTYRSENPLFTTNTMNRIDRFYPVYILPRPVYWIDPQYMKFQYFAHIQSSTQIIEQPHIKSTLKKSNVNHSDVLVSKVDPKHQKSLQQLQPQKSNVNQVKAKSYSDVLSSKVDPKRSKSRKPHKSNVKSLKTKDILGLNGENYASFKRRKKYFSLDSYDRKKHDKPNDPHRQRSGGIIYKKTKNGEFQLLLVYQTMWSLPKGQIEKGETIVQCAVREIYEETGLKVKIEESDKYITLDKMRYYFIDFSSLSETSVSPVDTDEITNTKWVTWKQLYQTPQINFSLRIIKHNWSKIISSIGKIYL